MGGGVSCFTAGKDLVSTVQEAGWVSGPVWTGMETLAAAWKWSLDHSASSKSLHCPGNHKYIYIYIVDRKYTELWLGQYIPESDYCVSQGVSVHSSHFWSGSSKPSSYFYLPYMNLGPRQTSNYTDQATGFTINSWQKPEIYVPGTDDFTCLMM